VWRRCHTWWAGIAPAAGEALDGFSALSSDGRQAAIGVGLKPEEVEAAMSPRLQLPQPDEDELEDASWFHREWIREALKGPETDFYQQGRDTSLHQLPHPTLWSLGAS